MGPALARERRLGGLLVAGGCLPFAAGAVAGEGAGLPCPFRAATGVPCPLCGASRAFGLAARGDAGLLRYNAAWVALAALAVLAGLLAVFASLRGRTPVSHAAARFARPASTPPRVAAALILAAMPPWAYALAQRDTIVGG